MFKLLSKSSLVFAGAALALSGCSVLNGPSNDLVAQTLAQSYNQLDVPARSAATRPTAPQQTRGFGVKPVGVPLADYPIAQDFKAVAGNRVTGAVSTLGASADRLSLALAERDAVNDCTYKSKYVGECEVVQVGAFRLVGSNQQRNDQRWQYMRAVHQNLVARQPLNSNALAKVLMPGNTVGDAFIWLSSSFENGGYIALKMPNYGCTGTLNPVEARPGQSPSIARNTIGLVEFSCQSNVILQGGFVSFDARTKLFYLENKQNERWEFILSDRAPSVGYDRLAFKRLFAELEQGN